MTSHELARLLLTLPDRSQVVTDGEWLVLGAEDSSEWPTGPSIMLVTDADT